MDDMMTDAEQDEFERNIKDTQTIATRERALEILDVLDREIACIQAQLLRRPNPDTDWFKRAAYACAIRRQQRQKVCQREREFRGMKGPAQTARRDPALGLAKQARLMEEAQARKAAKVAKHTENLAALAAIKERQSFYRKFYELVKSEWPEVFQAAEGRLGGLPP